MKYRTISSSNVSIYDMHTCTYEVTDFEHIMTFGCAFLYLQMKSVSIIISMWMGTQYVYVVAMDVSEAGAVFNILSS